VGLTTDYADRLARHTAFALQELGQIPEAFAGISLGPGRAWRMAITGAIVSATCSWRSNLLPATLALFLVATTSMAQASEVEWQLSQRQVEMGPYTVYVTKHAVKIVNAKLGYEVVAKAPIWKVVVYRPKENKGIEMSAAQFSRADVFGFFDLVRKNAKRELIKVKTETTNGITIDEFRTPVNNEHVWVTQSMGAPFVACDIIESCYRLRPIDGVPIREKSYHPRGKKIAIDSWMSGGINIMGKEGDVEGLKTYGWKKIPYNAKDFDYPIGFKNVKDPHELVFSQSKKTTMEDVAKDLGIGEKLGLPRP